MSSSALHITDLEEVEVKSDGLYVTSDPHFGERVHIGGFSSAEERDEYIIKRWNETVEPGARVLVLGDVGGGQKNIKQVARLHGQKWLMLGNHDTNHSSFYLKFFVKILPCWARIGSDFLLTHVPIHPCELQYRSEFNVHGHCHRVEARPQADDSRYKCVCIEQTGYAPVLWDEIEAEVRYSNRRLDACRPTCNEQGGLMDVIVSTPDPARAVYEEFDALGLDELRGERDADQ